MSIPIGIVYALLAAVLWGVVYTIDQKVLAQIPAFPFLVLTSVITGLVLLPFLFFEGGHIVKTFLSSDTLTKTLLAVTLVVLATANLFMYLSIQHLGAATASIVEITYPFFVILFSVLIYHFVPNIYFLGGSLLIFLGSALIIYTH